MANNCNRPGIQSCYSRNYRGIIRKIPVTVQFLKIRKNLADIIKRIGALRMSGYLGYLPGSKRCKYGFGKFTAVFLQTVNFFIDINIRIIAYIA